VGVVCIATLGLIGVGAHAAFTTSTTSGQTITAAPGRPSRRQSITRRTITTTDPTAPTASITYPVDGTSYGTAWTGDDHRHGLVGGFDDHYRGGDGGNRGHHTNKWWNGSSFNDATQSFVAAIGNTTWLLSLGQGASPRATATASSPRSQTAPETSDQLDGEFHLQHGSDGRADGECHLPG